MNGYFTELVFRVQPGTKIVVLTESLIYMAADGTRYEVPKGFRTDLASVPKWLWSVTAAWHRTARAGVLHDCAYRWGDFWNLTRGQADALYYEALRTDGLSSHRAWLQWSALRAFGWAAWNRWRETEWGKGRRPPLPRRRI